MDQEAVDATSMNAFKSKLDRLRYTRMGFFLDQSAETYSLLVKSLLARPHKVTDRTDNGRIAFAQKPQKLHRESKKVPP